jgi:hypothetical protein
MPQPDEPDARPRKHEPHLRGDGMERELAVIKRGIETGQLPASALEAYMNGGDRAEQTKGK